MSNSRSQPRPPTCSLCNMIGHNRRGCHLNPRHMEGSNINLTRYNTHNRTHQNILRNISQARQRDEQRDEQRDLPVTQRIRNELDHIAHVLQSSFRNTSSSSNNTILSRPDDLMTPVHNVFTSENCPICMETLGKTNIVTTRCGHQLCVECFSKNLIEAKSNKCPVCRVSVV